MPMCYHCGQDVPQTQKCNECGQEYCSLHQNPTDHDCNIVKESFSLQFHQQPQYQTPSYIPVHQSSQPLQERINNQQTPVEYQQASNGRGSTGQEVRGTTDGSFTWHHQEAFIPENAFDPESGIDFKGILLAHKSEALHLFIGATLIYIIGLMGFYNPMLIDLGLGWAIFMLAGFYTTAFLFHEFGHRQTAKHFGLQTKFRLLTLGMIITVVGITMGIYSLVTGSPSLPSIALPGAVVVLGLDKIDRKTGLCKAAGPTVNLIYGTLLLVISFMISRDLYPLNLFIGVAASLNFALGLFNMIPIGILDGRNIIKWNPAVWIILFTSLLIGIIIAYANIYAPIASSLYVPTEWQSAAAAAG